MPLLKQAHGAGARGKEDGGRPGLPPHTQQHRVQRQGQRPLQLRLQGPSPATATTQNGAPQRAKKKTATPSLGQGQYRNSAGPPSPRRQDPQPRPTGASATQPPRAPSRPLSRPHADLHARTTGDRPPPAAARRRLGGLTGTPPPRAGTTAPGARAAGTRRTRFGAGAARRARCAGSCAFHSRCPPGGPLDDAAVAHYFLAPLEGGRSEGPPAGGAVAAWLARPDGSALSNVTMCRVHCCASTTANTYVLVGQHPWEPGNS